MFQRGQLHKKKHISSMSIFHRLVDAWNSGENDAVEALDIDFPNVSEGMIFAAVMVCIVTTIYIAWHATYAVTRFVAFLYDTLLFFIRACLFVSILTVVFFYCMPPEVLSEVNELCAAMLSHVWQQGWNLELLRNSVEYLTRLLPKFQPKAYST